MKDTRVNIRIPVSEKELWQEVADRHGLSLTELVTRSVRGTILSLQSAHPNATNSSFTSSSMTGTGNTAAGAWGSTGYVIWDQPGGQADPA